MRNSITTGEISWSWDRSNETVSSLNVTLDGVEIKPISEIIKELGYNSTSSSSNCALIKARLVFWSGHDFFNVASYVDEQNDCIAQQYELGQSFLRKKGNNSEILPIIHVSAFPLKGDRTRKVFFPRYSSIMDSSIWNSFFVLDPSFYNDEKESQSEHFKRIIESISKNYIDNRYRLNVALEYADLSARLTFSSFIQSMEGSGHGTAVSPFLFHSERHMAQEVERLKHVLTDNNIGHYWRVLIIDDHAEAPLSVAKMNMEPTESNQSDSTVASESHCDNKIPSKYEILKFNLEEIGFTVYKMLSDTSDNNQKVKIADVLKCGKVVVEIKCCSNIKEALELLTKYKFDIILLDYLLSSHSLTIKDIAEIDNPTNGNDPKSTKQKFMSFYRQNPDKEYGYQLLSYLKLYYEDKDDNDIPANNKWQINLPSSGQYIMFMSAFSYAVAERLRAERIHRREKYWFLEEGACPVNTPELFKYYLIRIMKKRTEHMRELSHKKIWNIVYSIFSDGSKIRYNALDRYSDVLSLLYYYQNMLKDVDPQKESKLVKDFLDNNPFLGGLLEHLHHLVHLIAFGTTRQESEIREEYNYFRSIFDSSLERNENQAKLVGDRKSTYNMIETYILNLRGGIS